MIRTSIQASLKRMGRNRNTPVYHEEDEVEPFSYFAW